MMGNSWWAGDVGQDGKVIQSGTLLTQPKNITGFAQDRDRELYAPTYDGQGSAIAVPE